MHSSHSFYSDFPLLHHLVSFSPSFCLLYYFPLCIFSLSSPSRLSCLLTLRHRSPCCPHSPPNARCISLCFSCIRPTVLWLFPCLNLIAHLWLRRKQHCNSCVHYVQHIHNTTEEILILNTLNAKTNTCGHKQRPQTDTQQNPFDINNW